MTYGQYRQRKFREYERKRKHQDCPCGCGEMRDECPRGSNPMGVFDRTTNDPNPYHANKDGNA
jgi:hypothetical protein